MVARRFVLTLVACATLLSVSVGAEEIKTKDGKTYDVLRFLSPTPIGVNIEYKKNGWNVLQYIPLKNLPVEIQKRFGYSSVKAAAYVKRIETQKRLAKRDYELKLKKFNKENKAETALSDLRSRIIGRSINVYLDITKVFKDAFLAWATDVDPIRYLCHGEIIVIRMNGTTGDQLASVLYPTQTYRNGYPVYTPYLDLALDMAKANSGD